MNKEEKSGGEVIDSFISSNENFDNEDSPF